MKGWNEAVEVVADAIDAWQVETHWWGDSLPSASIAEAALTALLEATQSEPCATCGGEGYQLVESTLPTADIPRRCPDCTNGRIPGAPLVLLAPRQVGCGMTVDELHAQFSDGLYQPGDYAFEEGENFTNAPWEPLYAAQIEEKQT